MLLNQLRVITGVVFLTMGSGYWLWHAVGAVLSDKGSGQAVGKTAVASPKPEAKAPISTFRLTGTVKVEGTDEPVARATLQILIGNVWVGESQHEESLRPAPTAGTPPNFRWVTLGSGSATFQRAS